MTKDIHAHIMACGNEVTLGEMAEWLEVSMHDAFDMCNEAGTGFRFNNVKAKDLGEDGFNFDITEETIVFL